MSSRGWDIAMRHIDKEFDIPQFAASSLVRKIASSQFPLTAKDRVKYQLLPDSVITRIEQIVRESYLEGDEDDGGETVREHLREQALNGGHDMVANGELLAPTEFRTRIGVSQKRLARLVEEGSVFAVDVDDTEYFPAVSADPLLNCKRLQTICRIIFPAQPMSRLDFLTSRRGSLGDRSPVEMLENDDDFERLRQAATVWAAEWSRTTVKAYEGEHETEPDGVAPLYTASAEIDPRRPLWERVSEALHVQANG